MLHPDLSISSTLRAKAQRPRFPGCPQLHTTNGSPLQGSCHFWDPHITILLILNFPLIQRKWDHRASVALCPTTSPQAAQALHSSHAGFPAILSMRAKCVPTSGFLHCCSLYWKCYFPVTLHTGSLTSKCQHCSSLPPLSFPLSCLIFIHHTWPLSDIL